MNKTGSFSEIEMRLLAVLEEAWEENFCTLVNTVISCSGQISEPESVRTALHHLLELSLILLSSTRDSQTLRWVPMSNQNSLIQLEQVVERVSWSQQHKLWEWKHEGIAFEALLTDKGAKSAHRLLARYGWELAESPITLMKQDESG